MRNWIISLVLTLPFLGLDANAMDNRCVTRRTGEYQSACLGRTIPAAQARNHHGDQRLECSGNVDHYIRTPQRYDFNLWSTAVANGRSEDAYRMRRESQPDIKWKGRIPYQTLEVWTHEVCEVVTSASKCGTHTETRRYDCSYTTPETCSGSGKNRSCRSGHRVSKTCTEQIQVPNTCWADIDHVEVWPCSRETMTYEAEYVRPTQAQWNPKTPEYKDAIPNKYDLLPGELEDVQTYNTSSRSSVMTPTIKIGDAWNEYGTSITVGGQSRIRCVQNSNYHAVVAINTIKRNIGKKTPNAFRLPRDVNGKKMMPIDTKIVGIKGADGKPSDQTFDNVSINADGSYVSAKPMLLMLDDTASAMMSLIAEQSQKNADREEAKQLSGQGRNPDGVKTSEFIKKDPNFFKNTRVRVQLVQDNRFWWNTKHTRDLFSQDMESTGSVDFRVNSARQDIKFADLWKVDLEKEVKGEKYGIYQGQWLNNSQDLKPGKKYLLKVSMYQRGAKGFYLQDCSEDPNSWRCKWYSYPIFMHRSDDDVFSEPLEIRFQTPANMDDKRSFGQKFADFFELF